MAKPDGTLTEDQFQIMQILWDAGNEGCSAAEIWEHIAQARNVGRTTILKQIQRLESRGWLRRKERTGVACYVTAIDRDITSRMLAGNFVNGYFDGSLSDLVMSLLGSRKVKAAEIRRLRELLDDHSRQSSAGRKP